MSDKGRIWFRRGLVALGVAVAIWLGWRVFQPDALPEGIVAGNGRVEAQEIAIAAKTPGRIEALLVDQGDMVKAGQVVARMDVATLRAGLAEAEAMLRQAQAAVGAAQSQVAQRLSEHASALALVRQREAEREAARKRLARSTALAREGATSEQERDDDQARAQSAAAMVDAARAQLAAIDSAVATARAQVAGAASNVAAAEATIRRVRVEIDDAELRAPTAGRVQYRIAEPGEVVGAGARVLSLVNLDDVYMTFFLPEAAAGRVAIGGEARLVLDAAPDHVIPARISFVADVAQFTPKTVETESERQKLMFRVQAAIDPAMLRRYAPYVKPGLPGMAYVRSDPQAAWPASLAIDRP